MMGATRPTFVVCNREYWKMEVKGVETDAGGGRKEVLKLC